MNFKFNENIVNGYKKILSGESSATRTTLPLESLVPFKDHPFRVADDAEMTVLVSSIKENGILSPVIVRPMDDKYEILSGHRRWHAAKVLGLTEVPVQIEKCSDIDAVFIMVDSNLHREKLLISETAFAYKMRLDALLKKRRIAADGAKDHDKEDDGTKDHRTSRDIIAKEMGFSGRYLQKLVRLTLLSHRLLDFVDSKKLPVAAAAEIAPLGIGPGSDGNSTIDRKYIYDWFADAVEQGHKITMSFIKSVAGSASTITREQFFEMLKLQDKAHARKKLVLSDSIRDYLPCSYTDKDAEELILRLLKEWSQVEDGIGKIEL